MVVRSQRNRRMDGNSPLSDISGGISIGGGEARSSVKA